MGHNHKFIGGQTKSTTLIEEIRRNRPIPPIVHKVEEKNVVEKLNIQPQFISEPVVHEEIQKINMVEEVKRGPKPQIPIFGQETSQMKVVQETNRNQMIPAPCPPGEIIRPEQIAYQEEFHNNPSPLVMNNQAQNVVQETNKNQMIPAPSPPAEIIRQEQIAYQEEIHNNPSPLIMNYQTRNVVQETRRNQLLIPHGPHGPPRPHRPYEFHARMIRQEQITYQEEKPPQQMYNHPGGFY